MMIVSHLGLQMIVNFLFYVCWFHFQAWEETYAKWDQATKQILKNKADDGQVSYGSIVQLWVASEWDVSHDAGVI